MKPIIGIVLRQENDSQIIKESILKAITKYGGDFLLLPITNLHNENEEERIKGWLNSCDAYLFPGGDTVTDFDLFVLKEALNQNKPILGICLGMQLMASYPEKERLEKLDNLNHKQEGSLYVHQVSIIRDSNLYEVIKRDNINVNSRHSYKIKDPGSFKVVATSPDGVVEAIENTAHPFQIGVQWHPEDMVNHEESSKRIFQKFIEIAKKAKQ